MSSQHDLDPDLDQRCASAYGYLLNRDARRLTISDSLAARSARAYGIPTPDYAARRMLLSIGEASSLRFAATGDSTIDDQGELRQRYRKDLIRVGEFSHPVEGWTLGVTPDRLETWLSAFQKMRANGNDIEVTVDHDTSAESIRGYVVDMFVEDGVLFGVLEMIGKGIELAEVVKNVSVEIEDFTDGHGVNYGNAITVVSIGAKPVVPGQRPFERIAASLVA